MPEVRASDLGLRDPRGWGVLHPQSENFVKCQN